MKPGPEGTGARRPMITGQPFGPLGTNAWLIRPPGRADAVLIDAPPGSYAQWATELRMEGRSVTACLLTHGHWDHTADAALWQGAGARLHGHAADRMLFEQPEVMAPFGAPSGLPALHMDADLAGVTELSLAGLTFEVRPVPGHCPGNVALWLRSAEVVFVGDALFAGSVGRTDLPGGSPADLVRSIREQLYTLPPETVVAPGHGPTTTIGAEREGNPYVRGSPE